MIKMSKNINVTAKTWKRAKKIALLAILSKATPNLIGEAGIGKTEIVESLAKENGWGFFSINATNVKEGEMSMPMIVKREAGMDDLDLTDKSEFGQHDVKYITLYKLRQCRDWALKNPDKLTLLLIDEVNRADSNTMTEYMQLIQQKLINNFELPENVRIVTASNPSSDMMGYEDTDYAVSSMDGAMVDRVVNIRVASNFNQWLEDFATEFKNGRQNVHPDILEALIRDSSHFHNPNAVTLEKPTPRGWFKVSEAYYSYLEHKDTYDFDLSDVKGFAEGKVGDISATFLVKTLETLKNPMVTPEEIFKNRNGKIPAEARERILAEKNFARLKQTVNRAKNYLAENFDDAIEEDFQALIEVYSLLNNEGLKVSLVGRASKDAGEGCKVSDKLMNTNEFLNIYWEVRNIISNSS